MATLFVRVCDKCGKPLPIEKRKNLFGEEVPVFVSYPIHPFCSDFAYEGIDFCKACASEIDFSLAKAKLQILQESA